MEGTYVSPERVERDGRLVAFEGEAMTMEEAASRGLVAEDKSALLAEDEPRPRRRATRPEPSGEA